jgi:hypothetical protein
VFLEGGGKESEARGGGCFCRLLLCNYTAEPGHERTWHDHERDEMHTTSYSTQYTVAEVPYRYSRTVRVLRFM